MRWLEKACAEVEAQGLGDIDGVVVDVAAICILRNMTRKAGLYGM